nr:unnamed protein product [Spirometra erinaceieuropaei]
MANACWELFCVEHGIGPDGLAVLLPTEGYGQAGGENDTEPVEDSHAFFDNSVEGRYTPRTVLLDTEPSVIDEIRCGVYRNLFDRRSLINGKEDGASNYARGFYQLAPEYQETFENSMRFVAESCDFLDGICFYHSYGGGTGAGVMMALEEGVDVSFPKETKIDVGLYPSEHQATSVVEPYNAVLSACCPTRFESVSLIFDNHAIINVIRNHLDIECISFSHINRLLAQVVSGLTANWRFGSLLSAKLTDLQTNLIPYPGMRFLQCSMAPLLSTANPDRPVVGYDSLLQACLSDANQLARSDFSLNDSIFMACALLYRGNASAAAVNNSVDEARRQGGLAFADWSPCGYKIGICGQPMTTVIASGMVNSPLSLVALFNCTAVRGCLNAIHQQYETLRKHKAFYYWYLTEGLEEAEFDRAGEEFGGLMADYEDPSAGFPNVVATSAAALESVDNGRHLLLRDRIFRPHHLPADC